MQELMYMVGVYVNDTAAARGSGGDVLQICGKDVVDLLLLAVVGNFVSTPEDPNLSPQSSMRSMPTVVGSLSFTMPYFEHP